MKILFITVCVEDYLRDPIFIGLRKMYGADCIDYPKLDILYDTCPEGIAKQVRGNGFTLYTGLLKDIYVDRFNIVEKCKEGHYDLIVISDIWRQYGWFVHLRPWLTTNNTIVMDSADTASVYPSHGYWWRRPYFWFLPQVIHKFLYFKREWLPETQFSILVRLLPTALRKMLPVKKNLRRTSFSIPEEKIIQTLPKKVKDFPFHIVDQEVADKVKGAKTKYAFDSEDAYYKDLQESKFGITTIRAGWDCLRHYEIAANGTVICFRDLDKKPDTCAPHGLVAGVNCISYSSYDDLMKQINALSSNDYDNLQLKSWQWAKDSSSIARAKEVLSVWNDHRSKNNLPRLS